MKVIKYSVIGLAMLLFSIGKALCQHTEIGLGLGFMTYWGDLNASSQVTNIRKNSGFAFQLSYRKFFLNRLALRLSIAAGSVRGSDKNSLKDWQLLRNLDFHSNIYDLSVLGEIYLFKFDPKRNRIRFLPYATGGLSTFRFNPKTHFQGNEIKLQPLGTEGQGLPGYDGKYKLVSYGLVVGGGAKIHLSERVNISGEVVMHWTFTDYLDDVSKNFVTYEDLRAGNGTLAANLGNRMNEYLGQSEPVILDTGAKRGSPGVKDYFFVSTVSINFILEGSRFGSSRNRVVCPTFK